MGKISCLFLKLSLNCRLNSYNNFNFLKANFIFDIPFIIQITILIAILYGFGLLKNYACLLLFICNVVINNTFSLFGNGGDNLLYFLLIYMTFTNSYSFFSITKYKENKFSNFLSNLAVITILIHLCLIYLVSAFHKIHSDLWFNGVATYYILSLDRFCSPLNYLFSKNAFFIGFSTYATILIELFFPVLIWFQQTRKYFLIAGILMHLGIYFFMMIYDFEILFIMIYGFYITNEQWKMILSNKRLKWINIG